jgi:hypothetical protein
MYENKTAQETVPTTTTRVTKIIIPIALREVRSAAGRSGSTGDLADLSLLGEGDDLILRFQKTKPSARVATGGR